MLNFRNTNLNKLISSFEDLKNLDKKYAEVENRAYRCLNEWALDTNNIAIQDVTNKLTNLYSDLENNLKEERSKTLDNIIDMFMKFKEYDTKLDKFYQTKKTASKIEKKCINDIKKCPANKSMKDYELKYEKAKEQLELYEFKCKQLKEEIDVTKSILFKTQFKRMNQSLMRQNESEQVILQAMNSLLEKIPDVSNEEVENINMIQYTNHQETNKIYSCATKKLSRISTTKIKFEIKNKDDCQNLPISKKIENHLKKTNKTRTRILRPFNININNNNNNNNSNNNNNNNQNNKEMIVEEKKRDN